MSSPRPETWRILHIDDDEDDHVLVQSMLNEFRGRTVELDWVRTFDAGREMLFAHRYQAVLVDYDLDLHTGIDLIREAVQRGYEAAMILLTGRGSYEVDVEAMQAGATLYLNKNEANPLLLERSIRYAIERRQIESQLRASNERLSAELAERQRVEAELRRSNQALSESEQKFARIFEKSTYGAALSRLPDGTIVDVNEMCEKLLGYTREEMIGKTTLELGINPAPEVRARILAQLREHGSAHNQELRLCTKWGAWRDVVENVDLIEIGGQKYILSTMNDITERKQAEDALRKSEEKFARSFRSSPVALAISTVAEGRFIEVNDSYTELYGFSRGELIGHTSIEIGMFPNPEDRKEIARRFREGAGFCDYEIQLRSKSGEARDVLFSTETIDVDGQECMLSLVVDITRRKQAEQALRESEERLRESLENMHDSFYVLDQDWRFRYVNRRFAQMAGKRIEELRGAVFWETFPNYVGSPAEPYFRKAMQERVPVNFEMGGLYTVGFFEISLYPAQDGINVFAVDRTEEKNARRELQAAYDRLKRSNEELENFAFIASHDLQEPLRKVRMFGDSLRRQLAGQASPDALDSLDRIQNAAGRMQAMIDGLLDLSRVSTHGSSFEPLDLTALAWEAVSDLESRLHSSGGQVLVDTLPTVAGDAIQLRRLLQNLIGNSLKYHRDGVEPVVRVSGGLESSEDRKQALVIVEDNGIGFDEQQSVRIFQPFVRLVDRGQYEGSGMGLAICKKIVERHGGQITAHGQPGKGAKFIITLPAAEIG
jgi:PAS domain S-box-containing protein